MVNAIEPISQYIVESDNAFFWALLNKGMNLCWDRHLPKLEVVQ